ncbi:MAG: hypothetical protein DRO94_02865 [Candidatus Altiarchaeales archaeon]|nr:MAG: hypothetical protein DRO94_02865 [Candidatus Altiarchaeales archaeon]
MIFKDFEWFDDFDDYFMRNAIGSRFVEPLTDICETQNEIIVTMELPGVREEDIEINLKPYSLEVIARKLRNYDEICRRYQIEKEIDGYYKRIEFLPEINTERYKKSFINGILEIRLEKKTNRRIEVR